jgi:ribonuclease Z
MNMELIFLGTSSAIPSNQRNHSAVALKAFGEVMLFDCGEGTQRQMTKIKLSPMKVNHIFISHLHGDHFLGLAGMIQSMAFRGRKDPLHIYGPEGIEKTVKCIKNLGYYSLSFPIQLYELEEGIVIEEEEYIIKCCPTLHSVFNLAYSVEEKKSPRFLKDKAINLGVKPGPDFGKLQKGISVKVGDRIIRPEQVLGKKRHGLKIVYSGDTQPCAEMIKFSEKADVLIHDSTFDASRKEKAYETGHSTCYQAAEVAKQAKVHSLILTHISTRYGDASILKIGAAQIFENVTVAEDLMIMEVKKYGNY